MLGKPGPFKVIGHYNADGHKPQTTPPRRRYSCPNYDTCLDLAAVLNWESFSCRGCSGEINQKYIWQAHKIIKKDKSLSKLYSLPTIKCLENNEIQDNPLSSSPSIANE